MWLRNSVCLKISIILADPGRTWINNFLVAWILFYKQKASCGPMTLRCRSCSPRAALCRKRTGRADARGGGPGHPVTRRGASLPCACACYTRLGTAEYLHSKHQSWLFWVVYHPRLIFWFPPGGTRSSNGQVCLHEIGWIHNIDFCILICGFRSWLRLIIC